MKSNVYIIVDGCGKDVHVGGAGIRSEEMLFTEHSAALMSCISTPSDPPIFSRLLSRGSLSDSLALSSFLSVFLSFFLSLFTFLYFLRTTPPSLPLSLSLSLSPQGWILPVMLRHIPRNLL